MTQKHFTLQLAATTKHRKILAAKDRQ